MAPVVRRIVTGQTPDGRSVFTHVEEIEPLLPGGDALRHVVWDWAQTPTVPVRAPEPADTGNLPEAGGLRIETWELPPNFPLEGGHPQAGIMHSTDTVDVILVLDGEMILRQADDEREVRLRRGDVLVQNGAAHIWRNPSAEVPCLLTMVFFGATRTEAPAS